MSELEIPKGWKDMTIDEIGQVVTGSTPSTSNKEFFGTDYPFYKPADLDAGDTISTSKDGLSELGLKQSRYLPKNSILVVCIGASIGKTSIIVKEGASNQQINSIIPNIPNVLPRFLYYYILSHHFQSQIISNSRTTSLPIINKSKFEKLRLGLPPLETQKKIVQKLDYILGQLEEKKKEIFGFKHYKKLVNPKEILMQSTYDRLIDSLKNKSCNKNTLGSFTIKSQNGMTGRPSNSPPGTPRLGITSITQSKNDFVDENESKYLQVSKNDIISYQICKGDLLVCRQNGNLNFVGKFAMYAGKTNPIIFSDSLIRFQIDSTKVEPEYLAMFMNSSRGRKLIEPYCQTTAGNYSLNGTNLKNIEVIYPSIEIQKKLIEIKNKEFAQMDIVIDRITKILIFKNNVSNSINHLSNSILDKAFSGKLIN